MLPYWLTIFLSAFLLFQVQLVIGKYILPWFGGTPAVWTTCMLMFQLLLLGGYAYAHWLGSRPEPRVQGRVHLFLLVMSLIMVVATAAIWAAPLLPDASWKPTSSDDPITTIVWLLLASVGLPFFTVSTTAPLLQKWWSKNGASPYPLYALSNAGSLLGLFSYPFFIEPTLTLRAQAWTWAAGYFCFVLACGYCTWHASRQPAALPAADSKGQQRRETSAPGVWLGVLWLALSACASVMLLATTNLICQDVAVIPFLWVVPLSLYLLSFILCFQNERWYSRPWFHLAFGLAIFAAPLTLYRGVSAGIATQILVYCFTQFACCMICHGELSRLKPIPRYLTSFYFLVALGGALGGGFVALIAPRIFRGLWEFQLGLLASALLLLVTLAGDRSSWFYHGPPWLPFALLLAVALVPEYADYASMADLGDYVHRRGYGVIIAACALATLFVLYRSRSPARSRERTWGLQLSLLLTVAGLAAVLLWQIESDASRAILMTRNFYGVLSVEHRDKDDPTWHAYALKHGRITHGFQFLREPERHLATSYYGPNSGIGLVVLNHPRRASKNPAERSLRIGVIGLGVGTIAAYAQAGDYVRFYEINPGIVQLGQNSGYFSYLKDCPARPEVVLGDARISLERELQRNDPQHFDIFVMDAFTGDAVPIHLLTREAVEVYWKHLKPDGILAIHISNRLLDLRPVILALAGHFGLQSRYVSSPGEPHVESASEWVLLARQPDFFNLPAVTRQSRPLESKLRVRLWTDDYSNLFGVLKR